MSQKLLAVLILICAAGTASAAVTVTFNQDENGYTGTLDTGLYSGDAFSPHAEDAEVSIDEDGDFPGPSQGVIRFANIFSNEGGPIPTTNTTIGYAEFYIWADDPGAANSVIN